MDGQQYACVAKNLADGYGTWWFPYLSDTWWKADSGHFMEHPPLVYWIQAGFFKALGDSMYTERIYSFFTALVSALLIHKTWLLIFKDKPEVQKMSALPIILWIIVPVGFWGYQHNIMENTMGIFTLLAVYLFLVAMGKKGAKNYLYLLLCAITICLAFLSKGPPGLFPLVVIGCYWIAYRDISLGWMLFNSFFLLIAIMSFFLILTLNQAALESLSFYVNDRLLYRVENEPTTGNRFDILLRLFMELLPSIGFVLLSIIISYLMKLKPDKFLSFKKEFLFFLMLGLAGSLPLMLTPVQRGFYLNPSFPFFGIALACIAAPFVLLIGKKIKEKKKYPIVVKTFSVLVFVAGISLTVMNFGNARRDGDMIADVHAVGTIVPERTLMQYESQLYEHWNLQFYFMRYYGISLSGSEDYEFFLVEKGHEAVAGEYEKIPLDTKMYDLFRKK